MSIFVEEHHIILCTLSSYLPSARSWQIFIQHKFTEVINILPMMESHPLGVDGKV